jgi:hypothetical protein
VYDTNINPCPPRGAGITPYDKDGDGTPDIYDLDTDNDNAPDVNEGSGIYGNFVNLTGDADGDGLIDQFDIFDIRSLPVHGNYSMNVVHSNMGLNGSFDGPVPGGSNASLPKSKQGACPEGVDRDWRDISILPITLLEFKGNMNTGKVKLTWVTSNENNVSHYVVERSVNGGAYTQVGRLSAKGNNSSGNFSYDLNDDVSTLNGSTVYYRLRQAERSGLEKLSNVLSFKLINKAGYALSVYPSPATDFFTIKVNTVKDGMATIRVTDFAGRILLSQNKLVSPGANAITFSNVTNITAGTYNVQVLINGEVLNERLVIVR